MQAISETQPLLPKEEEKQQQQQQHQQPSSTTTTTTTTTTDPEAPTSSSSSSSAVPSTNFLSIHLDDDQNIDNVRSLDFERVVNQYSIQAVRDEWNLSPRPVDGSLNAAQIKKRETTTNNDTTGSSHKEKQQQQQQPQKTKPGRRLHRHLFGYTGEKATRWVLSCLASVLTGLTSIFLVQCSDAIVTWRHYNLQSLIIDPRYSDEYVFAVFLFTTLIAALAASLLCVAWVPQAIGSGISRVKAYLNGVRDDENFMASPSIFFVKVVSTILSVSSGLAVGQEGPLIHIGAIMGSGCSRISGLTSKYLSKMRHNCCCGCCCCCSNDNNNNHTNNRFDKFYKQTLTWTATRLSHFATHAERRDLVSIGASCGFAASFGAPVGGLLFILDDVSTYFSKSLILRILVANVIGTFCLAIQHGNLSNYSVINLGSYSLESNSIFVNRVEEIPLYIFMGIVGGVLGGYFCMSIMILRRYIQSAYPSTGHEKWQLLEVALVSIVTSALIFYLPSQKWACTPHSENNFVDINYREAASLLSDLKTENKNRFFCPTGEINELANMLFGSRIEAIKRILTDPSQFQQETLLTVGVLFYGLMTVTFGIAIPSGIFTPTVLIGASLGGAAGMMFQNHVDPDITPSTFALLGVAALLAGIQRSTVSVAVILVEGTGQIKVLMPAIMTVIVARYVANMIHKEGIFEAVMVSKDLPYLEHEENHRRYDAIEVGEIMSECQCVSPVETANGLVELLRTSSHHGFPVVDPKTKTFLGLIRRDQIVALIECGVFEPTPTWKRPQSATDSAPLMRWAYRINDDRYDYIRPSPDLGDISAMVHPAPQNSLRFSPKLQTAVYEALPTEFAEVAKNESGLVYIAWLHPKYYDSWVNIGAVMNRGSYVVTEFCPVSKAYKLFTSLGLRHLIVLGGDSGGKVVGILSRGNLLPEYIKSKTGI